MASLHASGTVTAVPVSPSEPDVIDLGATRRLLQEQAGLTSWTCPACELAAGQFEPAEAAWLADVHNQLMHRSSPVARTGGPVAGLDRVVDVAG